MTPFGRPMLEHWMLDPEITYLNHGTVGATPRRVLAAQQAIRGEIERRPSQFLLRELSSITVGGPRAERPRMRVAADSVAEFVGARGEDLVFVDNATAGVNAVLRSLEFKTGDEILLSDHAYGSVPKIASFAARRSGARVVTLELPPGALDPSDIVEAFDRAIGPRTRLVIVDHITSISAWILPVAEIAARCRVKGVPILVDGAHAPGAIPVNLASLGVDWYAANLHKWAFAPRSSGFLWVAPGGEATIHPTVISHGLDQGIADEFDWVGTRDPSPFLAAPDGIAYLRELGLDAVQTYNHALAWEAGRTLARSWGTELPVGESMIGTMVTVPLHERMGSSEEEAARLRDALLFEDRIEVELHARRGRLWTRVSAQIYNDRDDVTRLAKAVGARG